MKNCSKCKQTKKLEEFAKDIRRRDGVGSFCRDCANQANRESYSRHAKNRIAKTVEWAKNNPEKRKEIRRRHYLKDPGKKWVSNLMRLYNITAEEYSAMLIKQNHCCAICDKHESQNVVGNKTIRLAVDHCHDTGKIRGLLCDVCNTSIGKFKHSAELLQKAISYIQSAHNIL